jgi:hypothetical protein
MTETPTQVETPQERSANGRRTMWRSVAVAVGIIAALFIAERVIKHNEAPPSHQVTYRVTGDGPASMIDYLVPGGQQQAADASLPWQWDAQLVAKHSGAMLYVSAQAGASGSVTCEIIRDGVTVTHNTSVGQYAIVTCSAPLS